MNSDLENLIIRHVGEKGYRPSKPSVIAKQLKLSEEATKNIRKTVKKLVRNGQLSFGAEHKVLPAGEGTNKITTGDPGIKNKERKKEERKKVASAEPSAGAKKKDKKEKKTKDKRKKKDGEKKISGVFHRAAGGFGFIRPEGTLASEGRDKDIFVPADDTRDAANGDTVLARIVKKRRGKDFRNVGQIIEVTERKTNQFVGTYFVDDNQAYVEVDAKLFGKPVYVGDPGAKNAQPDDKVVIEMVHFPKANRIGEGVITNVLGKHGQPGVDTALIISEFSLPDEFPEEVVEATREAAAAFDENDLSGRKDFTDTTVITIDPIDARDFDDAISLQRLENGHWQLGVHIADVAHFVRPGTPLDDEAKNRATSIYLPDRVIPMIPEIISNNLASLQPEKVRYSKTAVIEFTADGAPVATDLCSSAICSDRRFTYEEVDEFLENPKPWKKKLTPEVFELLDNMHELAMILRQRRMKNGSLELSMREVKIDLNKKGQVVGAHRVVNTVSHQIIEEFMLAANIAVAQSLRDREINFLRRMHENPDPEKLKKLTSFVRHLGFDVESLESRFEVQRLLQEVKEQPEEYAINFATLRSMTKAVYSPEDIGHFALNADTYAHFTSPIRRYPDLTVHRIIEEIEAGKKKPGKSIGALSQLGEHCSEREVRAQKAERELTKLKLLNFVKTRIGEKIEAFVTGVEHFGFFVMGTDVPAEGLVSCDSLDDDTYDYDDTVHAIVGRRGKSFGLGDIVEVEIAAVDLDRRELDFKLVRLVKSRQAESTRSKSSGSKSKKKKPKGKGKGKGKPKGKGSSDKKKRRK